MSIQDVSFDFYANESSNDAGIIKHKDGLIRHLPERGLCLYAKGKNADRQDW